jgi:hypothetical protein
VVLTAYDGLQLYLKENGNPGLIDGYTPEQHGSLGGLKQEMQQSEPSKKQIHTLQECTVRMCLCKMWIHSITFDIKVTECIAQKTELKSGSRLNNNDKKIPSESWDFFD